MSGAGPSCLESCRGRAGLSRCRSMTITADMRLLLFLALSMWCGPVSSMEPALPVLVVDDFQSVRTWHQRGTSHIASGEFGIEPATGSEPARMWFRGSSDGVSNYTLYRSNLSVDVAGYDDLVFTLQGDASLHATIEVWFNGNQEALRPVANRACTADWQEFRIPISGSALTGIGFGLAGEKGDRVHTALLRDIRVQRRGLGNAADLELPEVVVIPGPKQLQLLDEVASIELSGDDGFDLVVDAGADGVLHVAAQELRDDLNAMAGDQGLARVVQKIADARRSLVLILQEAPAGSDGWDGTVPARPEGYSIEPRRADGQWMIGLTGVDRRGAYWATKTFKQLVAIEGGRVNVTLCRITDYPTYPFRCMAIAQDPASPSVRMALDYKINFPFINWWQLNNRWANPGPVYEESVAVTTKFLLARGLQTLQMVCPYRVDNGRTATRNKIRFSDPEDLDRLFNTFQVSLREGNRLIALLYDDGAEKIPDEDMIQYGGMPQAHAHGFHQFHARLKRAYPDAQLTFLPQPYTGVPTEYLRAFGEIPRDVIFHWTGPRGNAVSLRYSDEDIEAYHEAIGGRRFIIFDNTPGQRHGLGRRVTFFDPYADGYGNLHRSCYGIQAMAIFGDTVVRNAQAMIIAEYMWNADIYRAEDAVKRVMAHVLGRKAVPSLLVFRHHYLRILKAYPIERQLSQITGTMRKRYALTDEQSKRVELSLQGARSALHELEQLQPEHPLVLELAEKYQAMHAMLDALREQPVAVNEYDATGTIELDLDTFAGGEGYRTYGNRCEPRYAVWTYGMQTPFHTLTTRFRLKSAPDRPVKLVLTGQDDDKNGSTRIQIVINDQPAFDGDNTCVPLGWSDQTIHLPPGLLQVGENHLVIRNLEPSPSLGSEWFMISRCAFVFE